MTKSILITKLASCIVPKIKTFMKIQNVHNIFLGKSISFSFYKYCTCWEDTQSPLRPSKVLNPRRISFKAANDGRKNAFWSDFDSTTNERLRTARQVLTIRALSKTQRVPCHCGLLGGFLTGIDCRIRIKVRSIIIIFILFHLPEV